MGIDLVLVEEAKRLRQKYYETKDYQGVYSEYLKSGHWEALKSEMVKARKRECEVCRSQNALNLHHLQHREWHDVWLDDLVWLCKKHHTLIHELGTPEGKNSYFLIRDTMRSLFEHDKSSIVQELEKAKNANISLSSSLQKQKAVEPQIVYVPAPEPAKNASRGIPAWIVILAVAISFGAGWLLKPSINKTEKAKPPRIERVK